VPLKNVIFSIAALLLMNAGLWAAQRPGNMALGVQAGNASGASLKAWFNDDLALDVRAGSMGFGELYGSGQAQFHAWGLFKSERDDLEYRVPVVIGAGAFLLHNTAAEKDGTQAGVLASLGLAYIFPEPFELYAEASPALLLSAVPKFAVLGAVGARYYFDGAGVKPQKAAKIKPVKAPEPIEVKKESDEKDALQKEAPIAIEKPVVQEKEEIKEAAGQSVEMESGSRPATRRVGGEKSKP
jgi:hypothetical protein